MIPYDLTTRENMIMYFSLKNKHDYFLENRDEIIKSISDLLKPCIDKYECVIIPESSSDFLELVIKNLNKPYIKVKKNSIQFFKDLAPTLGLQKAELRSHLTRMDEMGSTFKINLLKATQRKHYIKYLFKETYVPTNSIIIDDSNFSGTTRDALMLSTGIQNYLPLFSKESI